MLKGRERMLVCVFSHHEKEKIMSTQIDVQSERAYSEQYHEVLEQLYDKIESSAKTDVVFASPQKHDGLTIIPVASVGWRFGSGIGTNRPKEQKEAQRGMGVGGTMSVSPVGFIEVKQGSAKFRPIVAFDSILKMQLVGGLIALGVISLLGRRRMMKEGKSRGSFFNAVFSPHTTILARGGQTRRPRRASRPRFGLNRKGMLAGRAKLMRGKRTR
jgi:uncharacterized spore protein YtfJ